MVLEGKNIYDYEEMTSLLLSSNIGWPEASVAWGYPYPPWSIWAFYPLGYFNYYHAALWWLLISILLLYKIVDISLKMGRSFDRDWPIIPLFIIITALFCYSPFIKAFVFGQSSFILVLGITAFCFHYAKENFLLSGIFLSLTFIKPQLLFPLYVCIAFKLLDRRVLSVSLGATIGLTFQIILSYGLYPQGFVYFRSYLTDAFSRTQSLYGSSLSQILYLLFGSEDLALPILAIGTGISVLIVWKSKVLSIREIKYILPISLLSTPYSFLHSSAVLWPCFLAILGNIYKRSESLVFILLLCSGLFGAIIFSSLWTLEPASYFIPLTILFGVWHFDTKETV